MKLISKIVMLATVCVASLTLSSCNKDGRSSGPTIYGKWQAVKIEYINEDGAVDTEYPEDGEFMIIEFGMDGSLHQYKEYNLYDGYTGNFIVHIREVNEGTFLLEGDDLTTTFTHATWTRTYEDGRVETEEYAPDGEEGTETLNMCELTDSEMVLVVHYYDYHEEDYYYFERIN